MSGDIATDDVLLSAVELAREAAVADVGIDLVGDHLGAVVEDDRLVAHSFACLNRAYRGWQWTITLTRATPESEPTVIDVVLLPGSDAIVPPAWKPWSERVEAGDLGAGDVLPTPRDDVRLIAGFSGADDLEGLADLSPLSPSQWELGLGRVRVLSAWGRDDATDRWQTGDFGPATPMARQASHECSTCGFMLPVGGAIGQLFGLCANAMSPADGHVVSLAYGCGAHSEVELEVDTDALIDQGPTIDDVDFDTIEASLVADLVEPAASTDDVQTEQHTRDESEDTDHEPPVVVLLDESIAEDEQDQ